MTAARVDTNALKFNQISIVVLVLTGFIFDLRLLPGLVAVILLTGAIHPPLSLFRWIYHRIIVPAHLLSPRPAEDDGAAHRFAQFLGGLMLAGASIAFLAGEPTTGWVLSWIVVILAGVNLAFGFCAGCFLYYQIRKFRTHHHDEAAGRGANA